MTTLGEFLPAKAELYGGVKVFEWGTTVVSRRGATGALILRPQKSAASG